LGGREVTRLSCAMTIFHVKLVHTLIFAVLSVCVLYVLISGVFSRITGWTWGALSAVVVEGLVLAASGWKCPLTKVAERLGAADGSVADIYLPKWCADRIFLVCGTIFVVSCVVLLVRLLVQ
jgi:hypothetical protein